MPLPVTNIRTSHAISIKVNDRIIGHIQSWAPSQARDVKPKYEINAVGTGAPIEYVPGIATTQTVQIVRYDLYIKKMEEIWGAPKPLWVLTDQHNPIDVEETWLRLGKPDKPLLPYMKQFNASSLVDDWGSTSFGKKIGLGKQADTERVDIGVLPPGNDVSVEKFWYSGCWFTSLGRNIQARGDRIVSVNATMVFTKVRPLL